MLCWKANVREVVTAGKDPLEWESELRGECGSLSLGCFHIWNKSRLSKAQGEKHSQPPGSPEPVQTPWAPPGWRASRGSTQPPVTGAGLCPSSPVYREMVAGHPVCSWKGGGISWAARRWEELWSPWWGLESLEEAGPS